MLPEGYRAQFLAEYTVAVEGVRRPEQFRQLQEMLRLWRLRAVAYSGPGYEDRLAAAVPGGAPWADSLGSGDVTSLGQRHSSGSGFAGAPRMCGSTLRVSPETGI